MRPHSAYLQIMLGLGGLVLLSILYLGNRDRIQQACQQLDAMAADAQVELQVGRDFISQADVVFQDLESTLSAHLASLDGGERMLAKLDSNLLLWRQQIGDMAETAVQASSISAHLGQQLPILVPQVAYDLQQVELEIPQFQMREQAIRLPYPTARLASRPQEIDLGVTKLKIDVPTLEMGTGSKVVKVPSSPEVTYQRHSLQFPSDFQVTKQAYFTDEKLLLVQTSNDLQNTAQALQTSAVTLTELQDLLSQDVQPSLLATRGSLQLASASLVELRSQHLPILGSRLDDQIQKMKAARNSFANLRPLMVWGCILLAIGPLGLLTQGCSQLLAAKTKLGQ